MAENNVLSDENGVRLDRWLRRRYPAVTFADASKWARKGEIRVNGKRAKASDRLTEGDVVRTPPQAEYYAVRERENVAVPMHAVRRAAESVMYEDDDIIVINKPSGAAAQGGSGLDYGLDAVMRIYGENDAIAPAHRLDKDTTGILVFTKNPSAAARWGEAFATREAKKTYVALTAGRLPSPEGEIIGGLIKRRADGVEKIEACDERQEGAKRAHTAYEVTESFGARSSLVRLFPLTGRTHQLRVHMAEMGCPIIGDYKYGYRAEFRPYPDARHMFLHARQLEHAGKTFEAPLPKAFADAVTLLRGGGMQEVSSVKKVV
ncbi:MAG: RluA family pseudouridine synthase [Rickettsiales bacterium]